jgi:capsular exopolysaccharide synthesis family protein
MTEDLGGLVSLREPKSAPAEAYRMLRTNLEYTGIDKSKKLLLFTSARMKDGKTTTISNLAITLAQAGDKVLLVDCDLRKPRIHKIFGLDNEFGITNVIVGNQPLKQVIKKFEPLKYLSVITAGVIPPMPAEILASDRMGEVLKRLSEHFDYVLIDTPPVLSVTDAPVLSRFVDGVIIVSALGKSTHDEVKATKKSLERVDANILGIVLTFAENKRGQYYNYYYDYEE